MKTSDYFTIKLRYYASPYMLKKFLKGDVKASRIHMDAAKKHSDFFWSLVENVTGNDSEYYYLTYPGFGKEYAYKDLFNKSGIAIADGEGWYYYMIPKYNDELLKWFLDNSIDIKRKILKRCRYYMYFENYERYLIK